MINRILIRIKVVQMLYSYLLTRKEFKIESAPESVSRDKRYGYALYLDLLLLILELSGYNVSKDGAKSPMSAISNNPLKQLKALKSLYTYDEIKSIISRGSNINDFDEVKLSLYNQIINSAVFKDFKKAKSAGIEDEVKLWVSIINTIISRDSQVTECMRKNSLFTLAGRDLAIKMLINTLSNYSDTKALLYNSKNALITSLDKANELYYKLLLLAVEITNMQTSRLEAAKNKYLPTADDINPNTKFIDNQFIEAIVNHSEMHEYLSKNPISWENDYVLVRTLLDRIISSEIYEKYMAEKTSDFAADCEFWRDIFKNIILQSEELSESLEAQSVYWNDDLVTMGTFVLKSIRQFTNGGKDVKLLPKFKDDEDAEFGPQLFDATITNAEQYKEYIDRFVNESNWDPDRLAFMDIVIMLTAITEITHFPLIPLPVSLNEYIEIANYYSTPKSGQFINGILYSIINYLKSEGKLNKN